MKEYVKKESFAPKIIVTDFSRALINSTLEIFNDGINLKEYLDICYNIIFKYKDNIYFKVKLSDNFFKKSNNLKFNISLKYIFFSRK